MRKLKHKAAIMADLVTNLASDPASFITGNSMDISGDLAYS